MTDLCTRLTILKLTDIRIYKTIAQSYLLMTRLRELLSSLCHWNREDMQLVTKAMTIVR